MSTEKENKNLSEETKEVEISKEDKKTTKGKS